MEKPRIPLGRRLHHRMVTAGMLQLALPPCALGEGALWHRETNEFVFTDILGGTLYACRPEGTVRTLLKCRYQTGAFLFDAHGDILLLTECGIFFCPYDGDESLFQLLWTIPMRRGERFNDAVCDPAGRIIAGTKTEENLDGNLWIFENGHVPRKLFGALKISNGMGFSNSGSIFYHTDSGDKAIYRFAYDVAKGTVSNQTYAVRFSDADPAVPDGLTLDAAGCLWSACWGGGCVRQYSTAGICLHTARFPASQISSVAFGGANLDTLLVTSAAVGDDSGSNGCIWLLKTSFVGVEDYRAAPAPLYKY